MTDFATRLTDLRRPRLLIRAARAGLQDYRRDRDLRRLIGAGAGIAPEAAMTALIEAEEGVEAARLLGGTGYSLTRHIDLLIALMAELRRIAARGDGARPV
ncbi:MAG TPA: DUF6477 family protein [Paracoccaceae bacterium]|nr:DUF6477 family protein [Paracoccaceae bacterium]